MLFSTRFNSTAAGRPLALALVCAASLVTYGIGLLSPYNVFTLGLRHLLNIGALTQGQPLAQARFVATFAILSALYYLAWRLCRGRQPRSLWIVLWVSALVINFALLWLYPIGAADLFDNIMHARVTAVYQGNPFYDLPKQFTSDPFYLYAAWRGTPSAYGPVWELLAAGVSRLAGSGVLPNILSFKLLGVLFYFGSLGLISATLRRAAPERALQGVCLFALNPLVLYETAGNGHNDSVMAFFIVLALFALARRWYVFSGLAATAGALVKFIPALLLPVILVYAWRSLAAGRPRFRFLCLTALSCSALVVLAYAPFWRNSQVLGLHLKEGLFTASLPAMIQANLEASLGVAESKSLVTNGALAFMGAVVLAAVWRTWVETIPALAPASPAAQAGAGDPTGAGQAEQWLVPVKAAAFILLCYLLFACLWFQAWYSLWPLAVAALLPEGEAGRLAVLLSYSALWKTIIFDYFLYRGGPLPPRVWRETWLAPTTLGVAWGYGLYALVRKGWAAYNRRPLPQLKFWRSAGGPLKPDP